MLARRLRALLLGAAVAALPAAVRADPRDASDASAQAEAFFRAGRRAAEAGDFATACARFAESQRVDPSTGTLLNLGDCEEHRGHLSEARNYFQTALAQLGRSDPRVQPAGERLTGIEARMPRLTVRLPPSPPAGTVVTCDGVAIPPASLGTAVPLDPGAHVVVVSAPGYLDHQESLSLNERQSRDLLALPGPRVSAPPVPRALSQPPAVTDAAGRGGPASAARTAGWIVAGAGAIGLALAGVSGIILLDEKSTVTAHCPQTRACDAAGAAAASANKTWLPLNTVAWIAGVVGAGAGAYLVLTAPSGRSGLGVAPQAGGAAVTTWVTF